MRDFSLRKPSIAILALVAVLFVGGMSHFSAADGPISWMDISVQQVQESVKQSVKVVINTLDEIGGALFDVTLTIPEESKDINPGEDLLAAIELTNIGRNGQQNEPVDVHLTYIITNTANGDVVFIEHETRTVITQDQFLKTLDLQELAPGKYNLFVEQVYGDAWAAASGEFTVKG